MINDILDLSKVESGKLEIEKVELSFPVFFAELTSWLRPSIETKGLKFRVEVKSKLPELVLADSTRIRQIILNLVSNAAKFTSVGTVSISVDFEEINNSKFKMQLDVVDTGIGMSELERERLFQPFLQADPSMTRKFGGTGLGLALSRALARAMDGDLTIVDSEIGQGSRFQFILPIEIIKIAALKNSERQFMKNALENFRILVAEDSPDNQFLMTRFLSDAGAKVTIVENGKEAIQHALSNVFDIIFMDVQMPTMDGLTATKELRSRNYKGPIIALTAHALKEERDRSLATGCNDHLTKPITAKQLVNAVLKYCESVKPTNLCL